MGAGGDGQGGEWGTVRAKRRRDAVNDFPTVATARTQPTRRQSAAAGRCQRSEENGTFLTRQAGCLCEGDRFGRGAEECG